MQCKICNRETVEKRFCEAHARAYKNLVMNYGCWKKAVETSWKEYLREIAKNPLTGEWAREVAQHLINLEMKVNVENC